MYLRALIDGESKYHKIDMKCDDCGVKYVGRVGSAVEQMNKNGKHNCRICVSRSVGKKVSSLHPEIIKNIGCQNKGRKHTQKHKDKIRKSYTLSDEGKRALSLARSQPRKSDDEKLIIMIDLVCGRCGASYQGRRKTALRQQEKHGHTLCNICKSVVAGKKTGEKMRDAYSENWKGDKNPMQNADIKQKIHDKVAGRPLSDAHKKSLCKPKSKTDKIREAANRPEERERRSKRMATWISNFPDPARGMFQLCHRDYVKTEITPEEIYCRSGLELFFIEECTKSGKIQRIESAEKLHIIYKFNEKQRRYLPDFKVITNTNDVFLVEIKCPMLKFDEKTIAKIQALNDYGNKNHISTMVLYTRKDICEWLEEL